MRAGEFLNRLWPLLFGYDIFISYRRADASEYAERLAQALQEQGFVCFLDREETTAGVALTPALRKALRRSRTLVALLSPGVIQSSWVAQEIERFLGRRESLIPISFAGFLSRSDLTEPFVRLQGLTWLNESGDSLASGQPAVSVVEDIKRCHQRMRVRTVARWFGIGLLISLLVGGGVTGKVILEGRRNAAVAYEDVRGNLSDVSTLLKFMVFASREYSQMPADEPGTQLFEAYSSPEIVAALERLDLAQSRWDFGPFVGLQPISPPGDTRPTAMIVSAGAQQIATNLDGIWRQKLPLARGEIIELTKQLASHPFLVALAEADEKLARYRKAEDSNRVRFYLLRNPGASSKEDYLDFLQKVSRLSSQLRTH